MEVETGLLSVVVPAYREGASIVANLQLLIGELAALDVAWEVIVVSDGNTDNTASNAASVADDRIRVIDYSRNRGKGYAVRTGVAAARGEWIAFIDADMEIRPDAIGRLLAQVRDDACVAIGSKRHRGSDVAYPLFRRIQSRVFQEVIRTLFRLHVSDTQTGLKVFRGDDLRAVLPLLQVDGFAFDLEWLVILAAGGARIVEGPVTIDYTFETTTGSAAVRSVIADTWAIHRRVRRLRRQKRIPRLPVANSRRAPSVVAAE